MSVAGWLRGHLTRRGRNARHVLGQLPDISAQWHQEFLSLLGRENAEFFVLKWRLDSNSWKPGDLPGRPRTANELAGLLGKSEAEIEALDSTVVSLGVQAMTVESYYKSFHQEMAVTLASADEWWAARFGSSS